VAAILQVFGAASGLHTNMDKCSITPIYGCDGALGEIQEQLPCQVAYFPIRYLGLTLSTKAQICHGVWHCSTVPICHCLMSDDTRASSKSNSR
jgi:hypothetical protein